MRAAVYVDGFNFYYGELKGTPFRWLDLQGFAESLVGKCDLSEVHYFTARVKASAHDPSAAVRQSAYLSALEELCPKVRIVYGHFTRHAVSAEVVNPPPTVQKIWKNEEKGSDVNLAVALLNDSWLDRYDRAFVVTNDSDIADALRLVKHHHPGKTIALVTPGHRTKKRNPSRELAQWADQKVPIREWHLSQHQLPAGTPGGLTKPTGW